MADHESRRVAFETARLRLARVSQSSVDAKDACFRLVTQVVADALNVDRVGVWMFEQAGLQLVCKVQFVRQARSYEHGQVLDMRQFPRYQAALHERRALAASDAREESITSELSAGYLIPAGIVSMLDAPIIREDLVVGVICLEQTSARRWTQTEIDFCGSSADIAALVLEQADRVELESALKLQTEQRLEQQKLEALGRMACSVAHDINNLLTVVMSVADESRDAAAQPGACTACTHAAESLASTADVGQRLVRQLMELGRREPQHAPAVDVEAVLSALLPTLRALVGPRVALTLDSRATAPWVKMQRAELEQVVLNLVVNAHEALGENAGKARIDLLLRDPDGNDDVPSDRVLLEVSDNGTGMDDHTRAHLFEPYFTTKPSGTGLGLAIVYGIAKRAGGNVNVASARGTGSTFQVVLPRDLHLPRRM
jgi:signal transduction histidine kinase